MSGATNHVFWLVLHEPDCVPERKGPFRRSTLADTLREFLAGRPQALIDVLTVDDDGIPLIQHAGEALLMCDLRSRSTVQKHNASVKAAFARFA